MADISKITVKGTEYDIKDAEARENAQKALTDISALSTLVSGALVYRGTKANLDEIQALSYKQIGDVYTALDKGLEYAWNGSEWYDLGAVNQITVDSELSNTSDNPVKNRVVKSEIDMLSALIPPFPTSSQNGMVLKVVNGAWAIAADSTGSGGLSVSVSGETLVIG